MYEILGELCKTAFQWGSVAAIVGAVSLRYWHAGRERKTVFFSPRRASVRRRPRAGGEDMTWLSLSEPADGGVSRRDPLSALSLSEERRPGRGQRLA